MITETRNYAPGSRFNLATAPAVSFVPSIAEPNSAELLKYGGRLQCLDEMDTSKALGLLELGKYFDCSSGHYYFKAIPKNKLGIHVRSAGLVVNVLSQYRDLCAFEARNVNDRTRADSILGLITIETVRGQEMMFIAKPKTFDFNPLDVFNQVWNLFETKFGESE